MRIKSKHTADIVNMLNFIKYSIPVNLFDRTVSHAATFKAQDKQPLHE